MNEFHEANELVLKECPDELAAVKIGGVSASESFKILSKMLESFSLPNGVFAVSNTHLTLPTN